MSNQPFGADEEIVVDASIIIAHLAARDRHHAAATRFFDESRSQRLIVHAMNLAEVLVGGVRAGRGIQMLDDLTAIGIDAVQPVEDEPLRLAHLRVETGLKLPDCCALLVAIDRRTPLASFDDRLRDATRSAGLVPLPAELPVPPCC